MVKTEMLMMLRHDLLKHPSGQISKSTLVKLKADFNFYDCFKQEEIQQVFHLLLSGSLVRECKL